MKIRTALILFLITFVACKESKKSKSPAQSKIIGTWKLITGITIAKGDTIMTDYTTATSFIKIINGNHFAFLQHDLKKGKAAPAVFVAGGGRYLLKDSLYTEHLEYSSDRNWENNDFNFTISIKNDTLIQKGIEEVKSVGVNRINIEKYVRLK